MDTHCWQREKAATSHLAFLVRLALNEQHTHSSISCLISDLFKTMHILTFSRTKCLIIIIVFEELRICHLHEGSFLKSLIPALIRRCTFQTCVSCSFE